MEHGESSPLTTPAGVLAKIYNEGRKPYLRSLVLVLFVIFIVEAVVMRVIYLLDLPGIYEAAIDALTLVLIVFPLLYILFMKPLLKQYRAALEARRLAETLAEASMELTQTLDLSNVFNILLDRISSLAPTDFASLYILETPSRLEIQATRGYDRMRSNHHQDQMWFDPADNPVIEKIIQDEKAAVIADIQKEPVWTQRKRMSAVHSWMGIPLIAGGRVIGLLGLGKREASYYTADHLQLAAGLVGQAAVAIQNAWLFKQVSAGNEQLRILTRRLVEVQEFERAYIARELHDEVGQTLTSLVVDLKRLEQKASLPEEVLAIVDEMNCSLEDIADNLHRLAANLHPAALDHVGLDGALQQLIESLNKRHGLKIHFSALNLNINLTQEMDTFLFRIVQEALSNAIRHGGANNISVVLQQRESKLILIVEDDGVGFDVETSMHRGRLGLFGMRERAETLGGNLLIESSPGKGTTIQVEVPYVTPDTHYR